MISVQILLKKVGTVSLTLEITCMIMEIMVVILVETRTLYAKSVIYWVMELTNAEICLIMHLFQSKEEIIKEDSGLKVITFLWKL